MVKFSVNGSSLTSAAMVGAERAKAHREVSGPILPQSGASEGPCLPPDEPEGHLLMETTPAVSKGKLNDLGASRWAMSTQMQNSELRKHG